MYSFPNLEPAHCSISRSNCCFLNCIQISQEAGEGVWHYHFLKNFPQFVEIHTKALVLNKAEVGIFLELSCFFDDPADVGNLISSSSASSKLECVEVHSSHTVEPGLKDFEHYFASL